MQQITPDGRYLVVQGRLWRVSNPGLPADLNHALVQQLMDARRAVKAALRTQDPHGLLQARACVDAAKIALGERGPVWWLDVTKYFNWHLSKNSPYARWYQDLEGVSQRKETHGCGSVANETATAARKVQARNLG